MSGRRIGRFTVSDHILRESIDDGSAAHLFAGAVPLDVERDWMTQNTTYICWHPAFRQVAKGEMVPTYAATFHRNEDGTVSHEWEEVKRP